MKREKEKQETVAKVIKMCKSENYEESYSDDEINSVPLPVDLT